MKNDCILNAFPAYLQFADVTTVTVIMALVALYYLDDIAIGPPYVDAQAPIDTTRYN